MAIINESRELEYGVINGVDTTSSPANTADGFVRGARNCDLSLTAGLVKRNGFEAQLESSWGAFGVLAGISFKRTGAEAETLLFNDLGTLANLTSGTAVDIKSGLASDLKPTLLQFSERMFFFNGDDNPFLYDGGDARSLGVEAPTVAPTKDAEIAGNLETGPSDAYVYVYTYYNSITKAESSPSPSLAGAQTSLGGIQLGITPGNADFADTIRVYRTVANGSQLILEGEAGIADTSFDSVVADDILGIEFNNRLLELDNSRIQDLTNRAEYAIVADNRIFVKSGTNELRFSKIGQSGPMPESFEVEALVNTESRYGASDPVVGLGQIKDRVIVLKQRSTGFLEPSGLNTGLDPVDNVSYIYRETSDTTGAISHFAGTQVYDEYIFLGRDNVYATNGIQLRPIGNTIQDTIKKMGFEEPEVQQVSAINDTKNKRVYIAGFENPGAPQPSFILVGDYQLYPNFRWTFYTPGDDTETHPGMNVGSFFTIQNSNTGSLDVYFTDSRNEGQYYKMNTGTNDDGDPIFFEVITRGYDHSVPLQTKLYKDIEILGIAESPFYALEVCARLDFSPRDVRCGNVVLPVAGGLWETTSPAVYNWADADESLNDSNTLIWSGQQVDIVDTDTHIKAKHIQFVFRQTQVDAPITLIAWGSVASTFSRK